MAAKFFTGLPLNGPECAQVHGQAALQQADPAVPRGPGRCRSSSVPPRSRQPAEPGGTARPGLRRQPARRLWF